MESWVPQGFGLVNKDVRDPELVNVWPIDGDKLLAMSMFSMFFIFQSAVQPSIFPVHSNGGLQGDELSFLIDFEDVSQIQRDVDLKRIINLFQSAMQYLELKCFWRSISNGL